MQKFLFNPIFTIFIRSTWCPHCEAFYFF